MGPHETGWIQELLKDLIERRKGDLCRQFQLLHPELKGGFQWLSDKRCRYDNTDGICWSCRGI
jgi:hypothetical protein